MKLNEIHIRDPFILTDGGKYYMYGSTGTNKFYVFISSDLIEWSEPKPCFEPSENFWGKYNFWAPEAVSYTHLDFRKNFIQLHLIPPRRRHK